MYLGIQMYLNCRCKLQFLVNDSSFWYFVLFCVFIALDLD